MLSSAIERLSYSGEEISQSDSSFFLFYSGEAISFHTGDYFHNLELDNNGFYPKS